MHVYDYDVSSHTEADEFFVYYTYCSNEYDDDGGCVFYTFAVFAIYNS